MSGQRHREIIERLLFIREIEERRLIGGELADEFRKKEVEEYLSNMRATENTSAALLKTEKDLEIVESESAISHILICYAHQDNNHADANKCWLNRFLLHLTPLGLKEKSSIISDQELVSINAWHQHIKNQLQSIKIVVLLTSPDFLASIYVYNSHFPIFLKAAQENGVKILPVVLRSCLLHQTDFNHPDPYNGPEKLPFSSLYAGHCLNKPLNSIGEDEQDQFFLSFAQQLLNIVNGQIQVDNQDKRILVPDSETNHYGHSPEKNIQNQVSEEAIFQANRENSKGWQTDVKGGSVYVAETINIHHPPPKASD